MGGGVDLDFRCNLQVLFLVYYDEFHGLKYRGAVMMLQ